MDYSYDSDSQSESECGSVVMTADHKTAEILSSSSITAAASLVGQEQERLGDEDGDGEIDHGQQSGGVPFDNNKRRRLDINNPKDSPSAPAAPPPPTRVISLSSIQLWDFGYTPISY